MKSFNSINIFIVLSGVLALQFSAQLKAAEDILDLAFSDLTALTVKTASKVEEPILKTISTTSVITAGDIEKHNCRDINDVFKLLPGIELYKNSLGKTTLAVRGVYEESSRKVLLLMNGHVLNPARNGNAFTNFQEKVSLDNIEKVELVKGAGSSLYGANASLAVINIVTFAPEAIEDTRTTLQTEFNDQGLYQTHFGLMHSFSETAYITFNLGKTENHALHMKETNILGNSGGEADVNTQMNELDTQFHYHKGQYQYQARLSAFDAGDYYGAVGYPYNDAEQKNISFWNDLTYSPIQEASTQLDVNFYLDYTHTMPTLRQAPDGVTLPYRPEGGSPTLGIAPSGIKYVIGSKELNGGVKLFSNNEIIDANQLQFGLEYRYESFFDPDTQATFDVNSQGGFSAFYDHLVNYPNKPFVDEHDRHIFSGYVQDLWDITKDLRLSIGGRYDHYSDFGGTFNPKVGVNYILSSEMSIRANIGSAYRAPDFYSLYLIKGLS